LLAADAKFGVGIVKGVYFDAKTDGAFKNIFGKN
jgi:hypothetical protein